MGWLSQSHYDKLKAAALALTQEQRDNLTWDEAQKFRAVDTLEIARWNGMRQRNELTPWQAVARLRGIE